MGRRYLLLSKTLRISALRQLRSAFLAAKDGREVNEIMKGVLTEDEMLRIGRRIEIASLLMAGLTFDEIADELKIGRTTIANVNSKLTDHPKCFEMINKREKKEQKEYQARKYKYTGGPKLIFKKKERSGFERKDVKR